MSTRIPAADLERILALCRVRKVSVAIELEDGRVVDAETAPGRMSMTYGRMPEDLAFLEEPVRLTLGQYFMVMAFRPDSNPLHSMMTISQRDESS